MITNFDKFNESKMKKFSKISKTKDVSSEYDTDENVNKSLDYDDKINSDILMGKKPMYDTQSNDILDLPKGKKPEEMNTDSIRPADKVSVELEEKNEAVNTKSRKVKQIGKVAKFPNGTKASKAYNYLEHVKISKNKIWYILIEKQSDELQMLKYETKKGVNLLEFVNEMVNVYKDKYSDIDPKLFENIHITGDAEGKYSSIKNIPSINVNGKTLIQKLTEDLSVLLNGKI